MQWRRRLGETLRRPFFEVFLGLESCMAGGGRSLFAVFAGLLLGWWIYVPLHELLHAFGCLIAGGEVTRLEIGFLYGGAVLASWIPWVVAGSEYAGRLSGFSTGGSDLVYLITPWALASFMSLTGDAYEIGSILLTWIPPWSSEGMREVIRGDDIFLLPARLQEAGLGGVGWMGVVVAAVLGAIWALAWWYLASLVASSLGQAVLENPEEK